MSIKVYVTKFELANVPWGKKKDLESGWGHKLLNLAVQNEYGIDTNTLSINRGTHGKPYFAEREDIHFNISHSAPYAAAAVSDSPVGIDIQTYRDVRDGLIKKICTETELEYIYSSPDKSRAFIHLWALKESYIKATGDGMSFPMNKVGFDLRGFDGEMYGIASNTHSGFWLKDLGDCALAVCRLEGETTDIAFVNQNFS